MRRPIRLLHATGGRPFDAMLKAACGIRRRLAGALGCLAFGALMVAPALAQEALVFVSSPEAKAAKLPFSEAVRVGDVLYLSGAIGNVPGKPELVPGGMAAQTRQAMANLGSVLSANGLSFDDVFKCTVMLADMSNWADFNQVYVTYFDPDRLPARSSFGANGLALGAEVEVECLAHVGK